MKLTASRPVAIIPARGGSKRIPRKNIREFHGQPLIARTIKMLLDSQLFEEVLVSTDDHEIADISVRHGAVIRQLRPSHLADDEATTASVLHWELQQLKQAGFDIDLVCTVYPAAVFMTTDHLVRARHMLESGGFDAVLAGLRFPSTIWRALTLTEDGTGRMIWPEHRLTRSQDLPEALYDAGQFYWSNSTFWTMQLDAELASNTRTGVLELMPYEAVDIDTESDWKLAEELFEIRDRQ